MFGFGKAANINEIGATQLQALLAALPEETAREAALAHSYPDWIAEAWWGDRGAEGARALRGGIRLGRFSAN